MPPKSFELEPGQTPEPAAPNVTKLAEEPSAPAPEKKAPTKGKGPDTAGVEQFLKAQIGSDRYKEIAGTVQPKAPEPTTPPRGEDGKFVKADKAKESEKAPEKGTEKQPPAKPKAPAAKPAAPFKPKPQPAVAAMTAEQVVAAAAEGAARAISAAKPKEGAEEGQKKPAEPELPQDEQDKVEVLSKMESLYPAKYKGLPDKYKKSLAALDSYAKAWEQEHPGQDFDEESPEHEDFFAANDVDWSDLDFQKALARLVAEDAVKPLSEKTEEKLAELDRAKELQRREGEIAAHQNSTAVHYWTQFGEDFADVVNPDGTLNTAKIEQLKTSDPEGFSLRVNAAQALDIEVAEIFKLYNGLVDNDWEHNEIHRNLNQFVAKAEKDLASQPTQDKLNSDGKIFVPAAEWYRMTKAEREQHWMFGASDIAFLRAKDLAKTTQRRVELAEEAHIRWAKARGIELENPNAKPESPSAGGESRMAAVTEKPNKNLVPAHNQFLQTQLHGS